MTDITISIENLSPENGINLSPFWVAFHDGSFDTFNINETASLGLELLAEEGITGLEYSLDNVVEFLSLIFTASGVDVNTILPILEDLNNAEIDFNALVPALEELVNADLEDETQQALLDVIANAGSGLDVENLLPILNDLTAAGVNTNTLIAAFQEINNSDLDFSTLTPIFEQVLNSNLDLSSSLPFLVQLLDSGIDLNDLLAAFEDPDNTDLDLSNLPPISNTLGELFLNSSAASNGGVQELVTNSSVETLLTQIPGETVSTSITLDDDNLANTNFFSFASMIDPSNDGFIGNDNPNQIPIFDEQGNFIGADFIVLGTEVWDAGTEVNDESPQSIPYTLDVLFDGEVENSTVESHPGFLEIGNGGILDQPESVNADFTEPDYQIARITITEAEEIPDLIVFGDSLSDTGNSLDVTGIPPSPPYFEGRVSNGIVAVEIFAAQAGLNLEQENNFAFTGATTGRANTNEDNTGLDLPGLLDQIDEFSARLGAEGADAEDLYFIWAGANDFFDPITGDTDVDFSTLIATGVANLITSVSTLNALGAENIVLANLVNLGLIPAAEGIEEQAEAISINFNNALEAAVSELDFEVTLLDFFGIGNTVFANPADFEFSNTDDALLLTANPENPEEFFFWDTIHPTTQGQAIFAETIAQTLAGEEIEPFFFNAQLTGEQEVAPNNSSATGSAQLRLNELATGLRYSLTVSGLDFGALAGVESQTPETGDDVTMINLHNAPTGANGEVVFGIINPSQDEDDLTITINEDNSTTISGIWEESDPANLSLSEFVEELRDAQLGEEVNLYFNIHTEDFPDGEIRGQITSSLAIPEISVFAEPNTPISEANSEPGTFIFQLSESAPAGGLIVNFAAGDSADPEVPDVDIDLEASTNIVGEVVINDGIGTVTITENVTEARLVVVPFPDDVTEVDEVISTNLLPGDGYTVDENNDSASLTITDQTIPSNGNLAITPDNTFTLSSDAGSINLQFNLESVDAGFVNEIGIYTITENQTTTEILNNGQVIFSALNQDSQDFLASRDFDLPQRILNDFADGQEIGFYLIANSTTDAVLAGFTPLEAVIVGNSTTLQTTNQGDGSFLINFEDNGGSDFNDVQVSMSITDAASPLGNNLQGAIELLDLRDLGGEIIRTNINATQKGGFGNVGGLYTVLDQEGTIFDPLTREFLQPGDDNYVSTALNQSVVDFSAVNPDPLTLLGGFLYAPYLLTDGDTNQFYSPFSQAHADGLDHLVLTGDNTFAFEDSFNLGNGDFNDFAFQVDLNLI